MPHSKNRILSRVSPVDFRHLEPHLRLVELEHGRILAGSRQRMHHVYFPHGGVLSAVVELTTGLGIETGMIGNDGVFGAAQALDHKISLNKVMVQVPGWATVVDAEVIKQAADASQDFRALLIKYEQFFLAQVQQTTACNAVHDVEQRMCKWLVRMYDLVGTDLPLTQEFLAEMMGVRRTSVTQIAVQMQKEGLISYHRGKVRIDSIELVQKRACECHATVREHYEEMFGNTAEQHQAGIVTRIGLDAW
jgi:CRP-like cAMP-binding protein